MPITNMPSATCGSCDQPARTDERAHACAQLRVEKRAHARTATRLRPRTAVVTARSSRHVDQRAITMTIIMLANILWQLVEIWVALMDFLRKVH